MKKNRKIGENYLQNCNLCPLLSFLKFLHTFFRYLRLVDGKKTAHLTGMQSEIVFLILYTRQGMLF
jgi:hypothetical protein